MNAKLINLGMKALPFVKKGLPIAASALAAAVEAKNSQKAAARIDDMERRIIELEHLFNSK